MCGLAGELRFDGRTADVAAVVGNPLVGIDGMLGRMAETTAERPSVP